MQQLVELLVTFDVDLSACAQQQKNVSVVVIFERIQPLPAMKREGVRTMWPPSRTWKSARRNRASMCEFWGRTSCMNETTSNPRFMVSASVCVCV